MANFNLVQEPPSKRPKKDHFKFLYTNGTDDEDDDEQEQDVEQSIKQELSAYVDFSIIPLEEDINPLDLFKQNFIFYPNLSKLFRMLLFYLFTFIQLFYLY